MKLKLGVQLSALVLFSSFATAEMKTGNDLFPACNAAVDFMDKHEVRSGAMECVAYVNGFIDGEQLGEFAASGNNVICPEKNVSTACAMNLWLIHSHAGHNWASPATPPLAPSLSIHRGGR